MTKDPKINQRYHLGLFRGYSPLSDKETDASSIMELNEHQTYKKAIRFLRMTGLIKLFDKRYFIGRIIHRNL